MLPPGLSYSDRFKMARDAGFDVVQAPTTPDEHTAEEIKNAAAAANIRIDSVMTRITGKYPLSSDDPQVWKKAWRECGPPSTMPSSGVRTRCCSFQPW